MGGARSMQTERAGGEANSSVRRFEAPVAVDFANLSLVPRTVSKVTHRAMVRPEVRLGHVVLDGPLVGSPMPDVCGADMCRMLAEAGCLGILHRFQPVERQVESYLAAVDGLPAGRAVGAAV